MPGQNNSTTISRSAADKALLDGIRKDADKMQSPLLSTEEMMRNVYRGTEVTEQNRTLYGLSEYSVPKGLENLHSTESYVALSLKRLNSRVMVDKNLHHYIAERTAEGKTASIADALRTETEREIALRSKEESYQKKTSEQEKAAQERNEPIIEVDTEKLKSQAAELEAQLAVNIQEDNLFAAGEREYQKQYLEVINDLIKTRASKGHLFGNYSKHIALAEEKYRFYSTERERIIGKEQAKLLMAKPEFGTELEAKKKAEPMPDFDLTNGFDKHSVSRLYHDVDQKKLARALREYREYSAKVYELNKRMEALEAVEDSEIRETGKIVDATDLRAERRSGAAPSDRELRNRKVIPDPTKDLIYERANSESYGSEAVMVNGLLSFKKSMQMELDALKFHADASLLCVRYLLDPRGEQYNTVSAHAGYLKEHFGVDIRNPFPMSNVAPGPEEKDKKLVQRSIAERVGLESEVPDISTFTRSLWQKKRTHEYANAKTGYELQSYTEKLHIEGACSTVCRELLKDPEFEVANEEQAIAFLERCSDMTVLSQKYYGGMVGEIQDVDARKEELKHHMKGIDTIRDSNASPEEVKKAIKGELGLVEDAFEDICFMMNEGETAEIFTAKRHEEIFSHTGGMPTFERKARLLRDLVSSMLKRSDILDQIEQEPEHKDLHKKLFDKWLFMNRALSFVDYRVQLMRKGYNSRIEDWAKDTSRVEDFRTGSDYSYMIWGEEKKGFVPGMKPIAASSEGAGEVPADAGQRYDYLDKYVRKEYYESPFFETREQQRNAIKQDLWKGMQLSSYTAAAHAIRIELASVADRKWKAPQAEFVRLQQREAELQRDLDSMDKLIERRREEIDRRADEILETVKKPDKSVEIAANEAKILEILGGEKDDDPVMNEIRNHLSRIMDPTDTPDHETALERLIELRDYMEPFYISETKANLERYKLALTEDMDEKSPQVRQYIMDRMQHYEGLMKEASLESMDRISGYLGTTYFQLKHKRMSEPAIFTIMSHINGMIKYIEAEGYQNSGKVRFESKVKVRETIASEDASGKWTEVNKDEILDMETQKAAREAEDAAYNEAKKKTIGDQRSRMNAAMSADQDESDAYKAMIQRLGRDTVDSLDESKDLSREEREFLSDAGCLVIPLFKEEDEGAEVSEEAEKALKEETAGQIKNLVVLKEADTADPAELGKALTETIQLLNRAYSDLEQFARSGQGSAILKARKPLNTTRQPSDPPDPDNYDQDMKGFSSLRKKASYLNDVIDLVLDCEDYIRDEAREELKKKAAQLEELSEFLDKRFDLILRAKSRLSLSDNEYIHELRNNPEDWSLDAFEWKA